MSWVPVTLWSLRCDGDTTSGQCRELYHTEDEDGDRAQVTLWEKNLTRAWVRALHYDQWMFTGERLLCPRHVAAAAYLAAAQIDGLPFDEPIADSEADR